MIRSVTLNMRADAHVACVSFARASIGPPETAKSVARHPRGQIWQRFDEPVQKSVFSAQMTQHLGVVNTLPQILLIDEKGLIIF